MTADLVWTLMSVLSTKVRVTIAVVKATALIAKEVTHATVMMVMK